MTQSELTPKTKPVVGISACVAGQEVRYNASHKRSKFCMDTLSEYFEYKAFCPEVAIGLPVPRPAIRIVEKEGQLELVESHEPKENYAQAIRDYAKKVASSLTQACGFILMQKSPTCGLGSTKVYGEKGSPLYSSDGIFVQELKKHLPMLPMTESGRLNDARLKEHFFAQVYALHDWQTQVLPALSIKSLTHFHYRHKLTLRIHNEKTMRNLGRLLANAKGQSLEAVADQYIHEFMAAMATLCEPKHHAYALTRLVHYMKRWLTAEERSYAEKLIDDYRQATVPLIVPMTHLKFLMQKYQCGEQLSVWQPYPQELGLQNAI